MSTSQTSENGSMESARWDETWYRLREWTKGQAPSERLAAQILISEGFKDLDPSHPLGGPDRGRDALCTYNGEPWVMAVYFPRGKKTISEITKKLNADVLSASKHNPVGIAFVTNQELTLDQRQTLKDDISSCHIAIFHLERLTTILDSPPMASVRKQFLDIESIDNIPILEVQFYEPVSRKALGTRIKLQSLAYGIPQTRIPNLETPHKPYYLAIHRLEELNPSYMREQEKYIRANGLLKQVFLGIRNSSTRFAEGVLLEIEGSLDQSIEVAEELPEKPVLKNIEKIPKIRALFQKSQIAPEIKKYGDQFRIIIKFGTIQPGHIAIMEVPIFLGSREAKELLIQARVVANNLPMPIESSIQVDFDVIPKPPLDINLLRPGID
jgi:hypothetical protein